MEDEERYLREQLHILHESYKRAAKPIIDHLVAIENRKPISMIVSAEDAARFFSNPPEAT